MSKVMSRNELLQKMSVQLRRKDTEDSTYIKLLNSVCEVSWLAPGLA